MSTATSSPLEVDPRLGQLAQALTTGSRADHAAALAAAAHQLLTNRHTLAESLERLGLHPATADVAQLLAHERRTTAAAHEVEEINR